MAVDLSESWIDEQIARELEMLSVEDLDSDEDSKEPEQEAFQIEQPFSTLPSCLEDYLNVMADQRKHVVSILDGTRDPASDERRVETPTPSSSPHKELVEELVDDEQLQVEEWTRVERETNDKEREETLAALAKLEQERVERERQLEEEDKQTEELVRDMQQQVALQWSKLEHAMRKKQAEEASKRTEAATVLQSAWRGTRARRLYHSLLEEQLETRQNQVKENTAATIIQKSWRKYRNRLKAKVKASVQYETEVKIRDEEDKENNTANLLSTGPMVAVAVLKEREEDTAMDGEIETMGATHCSLNHPLTITPPRSSMPPISELVASAPPTSTLPLTTSLTITARSNTPYSAQAAVSSSSTTTIPEATPSLTNTTPRPIMTSSTSQSTVPTAHAFTSTLPEGTSPTAPSVPAPPTSVVTSTSPTVTLAASTPPTSTSTLPESTITTHTTPTQPKKENRTFQSPAKQQIIAHTVMEDERGVKEDLKQPDVDIKNSTPVKQSNTKSSQQTISQSQVRKEDKMDQTTGSKQGSKAQPVMKDGRTVEEELVKMKGLRESWLEEELVAEQSRERMERLMAARESITMDSSDDGDYRRRLEHAACPLSERAWRGIVEEKLRKWQHSVPLSRRSVNQSSHHTSPPILQEKHSAKSRRPLSLAQLLDASPKGVSLNQVAMVYVYKSRSPVDLSCLSQCPSLQSLSLTKCSITSFSGVSNPLLQDITLPTNTLELMDCSLLPQLKFLDVSDNRLASIHGLQHCTHLLQLNVSDNRIARIGGLWACQKLQSLNADGNLIINSVGVESLHCLQYLSLAENHLPKLVGVVNCPLLQHVNIRQNNLQQCPEMVNHVLLRELYLDENSLSDITPLTSGWLPSLQTLSLANNCIMEMESLVCCVMLQHLNLANNSLYDLPLFLQSVRGCYQLHSLNITGNPLTQETKCRSYLVKTLPNLKQIDGEKLRRVKKVAVSSAVHPLYKLLSRQLAEQDAMREAHQHTITAMEDQSEGPSSPSTIGAVISTKSAHCKEYHDLLLRHLEEQRVLDCTSNEPVTITILKKQVRAVRLLQSAYRGWQVKRWSGPLLRQWRAARVIQTAWRRCTSRREERRKRGMAATVIQASVRGYLLRARLRDILKEAQNSNQDIDNDEDQEREVTELLSSVIDEDLLECDLKPLSPTEDLLDSIVTSHNLTSEDYRYNKPVPHQYKLPVFTLPGAIDDSVEQWEESPQRFTEVSKPDTEMVTSEHTSIHLSTNQQCREELADEWGFASPETAKLLMRRAGRHQQLRMRSEQRKKLAGSPTERLAQFKRLTAEPTNRMRWKEGASMSHHVRVLPTPERSHGVVFQWQHNHQVIHRDAAVKLSPVLSTPHSHTITSQLPPLEPHVLAGHTPRLVSSDAQNKLVQQQQQANIIANLTLSEKFGYSNII